MTAKIYTIDEAETIDLSTIFFVCPVKTSSSISRGPPTLTIAGGFKIVLIREGVTEDIFFNLKNYLPKASSEDEIKTCREELQDVVWIIRDNLIKAWTEYSSDTPSTK